MSAPILTDPVGGLDGAGVGGQPPTHVQRVQRFVSAHPLWTVLTIALLARWATSLLVLATTGGTLFNDDITYPAMAAAVVEGRADTWDQYTEWLYNATATYTIPLTLLYEVFGPVRLVAMVFTGVLGALVPVLAAKLVLETMSRRAALFVGLVLALLPSQVLFSSLTLKDAAVWLLLTGTGVLVAVAGRSSGTRLAVVLAGMGGVFLLLGHVRVHTLVVAAWAAALASLVGGRSGWWPRSVAVAALLVGIPFALGLGPAGLSLVASSQGNLEYRRVANAIGATTAFVEPPAVDAVAVAAEAERQRAEALRLRTEERQATVAATLAATRAQALEAEAARLVIEAARAQQAGRGTDAARLRADAQRLLAAAQEQKTEAARLQAATDALAAAAQAQAVDAARATEQADAATKVPIVAEDANSVARDLRHLPKGLVVMLLAPLPWQVDGNANVRFAALETLVWYPLLALAVVGLLAVRRHRRVLAFPLLTAGAIALMYGLAEGNFGTAYRHRGELVWAVVVLAAHGAHVLWSRRNSRL